MNLNAFFKWTSFGLLLSSALTWPQPALSKKIIERPRLVPGASRSYDGAISKYPAVVTLRQKGHNLAGSYAYKKVGRPIKLKGTVDIKALYLFPRAQNARLAELSKEGKTSAVFKGVLTDYEFFGKWQPASKKKKPLPFKFTGTHSIGPGSVKIVRESDFKYKSKGHKGVVYRPRLSGLPPQVLNRVQKAISFETVAGDDDWSGWLDRATYYITYNRNNILDILWWIEGSGAYPDSWNESVTVNLKNGEVIKAKDIFKEAKLSELSALVNRAMQERITEKLKNAGDPEERSIIKEKLKNAKFNTGDLDTFSIGGYGITFLYRFIFPHAIKALEPESAYFFKYEQLSRFLKKSGSLGRYAD